LDGTGRGVYDTCPRDELAKPVEALAAGCEVVVHRYDLPDDDPLRWAGGNCDALVFGADDTLRLVCRAVNQHHNFL
jgi:hypothetical protein